MKQIFIFLISCIYFSLYAQTQILSNKTEINKCDLPFLKDSIKSDYLNIDINIINNIINKLPYAAVTLDSTRKYVPYFAKNENNDFLTQKHDLGMDLKYIRYNFYGGYVTYVLSIIYYDSSVIKLNLFIDTEKQIIDTLVEYIKEPLFCGPHGLHYSIDNYTNLTHYISTHPYFRFTPPNDSMSAFEKHAFYYLIDYCKTDYFGLEPFHVTHLHLDSAKYFIKYFINNNKHNVLENIMFSYDPNSRVLAAYGLDYLADNGLYYPDLKSKEIITKIKNENHIFKIGLIGHFQPKYEYLDLNKDFLNIINN